MVMVMDGKWTVLIERLSSLCDHSKCFTSQLIHPFTHIHTLMAGATTQGANLLIRGEFNHSFTFIHRWRSNGVKCLAQGHIDMWTGGAGNRTANLPIGGRPTALPPGHISCVQSHAINCSIFLKQHTILNSETLMNQIAPRLAEEVSPICHFYQK